MEKGLDICENYFFTFGLPMLRELFPSLLPHLCAGLAGSGSECFGFDDGISRDHDFEPGFCLFLPDENIVSRADAFRLERAYASLPDEFAGLKRQRVQPVGGPRRGVIRLSDFLQDRTGTPDGALGLRDWLRLEDWSLAEATNGRLFYDGDGRLSGIRAKLAHYPEDILRKKIAGRLLLMAQSGQYNYRRCLLHGESGAAQLAACEFVKSAMHCVFLLNRVYEPYYKWSFRALRRLPKLSLDAELFEYLITTDNTASLARDKEQVMEDCALDIIRELVAQGLTKKGGTDLEKHAYSVQDGIRDAQIRGLHILAAC